MYRIEYNNSSDGWSRLFVEGEWEGDCNGDFFTREDAQAWLTKTHRISARHYRIVELNAPATDAKPVDSKIAFAAKKVPLFAVTLCELFGVARVKSYGGKKHGWGNYLKATLSDGAGERYVAAGLRHLQQMQNADGTWDAKSLAATDEESGLPHIDHLLCSILMLRGILVKDGALQLDPGEGNEPPTRAS